MSPRSSLHLLTTVSFVTLTALSSSTAAFAQTFDNGLIRFGNGSEASVNEFGNLRQPFYYSGLASRFYQLTFSNYPLDVQFGAGAGTHWTGSGIVVNPQLAGQVIDTSGFTPDGANAGYGTITSTGTVSVNGFPLQMQQRYTLESGNSYVAITTSITNSGESTVPNAHMWVGTRDDYVGTSDGPTKTKGRIVDGAFEPISTTSELAPALQITSGSEGVLFYSTTPGTNTVIDRCCSFENATRLDPATSPITLGGDGSYALYLPIGDIQPGETAEITWFYAAGAIEDLGTVIEQVAAAAAPTTIAAINTSLASPVLTGTYDATTHGEVSHATLRVTVDGQTYTEGVDAALVVGDGAWSLDLAAAGQVLSEGTYDVVVEATASDGGVVEDSSADEVVIDFTAPAAPTVDPVATGAGQVVIQGSYDDSDAEGGLSVEVNGTVYVLGIDPELTAQGARWQLQIAAPEVEGLYDVVVRAVDAAGNVATDLTPSELDVDLTAPEAPTVDALVTNQSAVTLTGSWDSSAAALTVTVNGIASVLGIDDRLTADDSMWYLDLSAFPLNEGTYDVTVTVADSAGNEASDASVNEVRIDLTAPAVPTVEAVITSSETPEISGQFDAEEAGGVLAIVVDGVTYTLGVDGALTANGTEWRLAIPAIAEGVYDVEARLIDSAGNISSDASDAELDVDRTAPAAPTVSNVATASAPERIEGTFDSNDGQGLTVQVGGVTYVWGESPELVVSGDSWYVELDEMSFTEGSHDVVVTITDAAGNVTSDTTTGEIRVDMTPPTAPTVVALLTNQAPEGVGGQYDAADTESLTVILNGVTYVAGQDARLTTIDGSWMLDLSGVDLGEGVHDVQVIITDAVGNAAQDATIGEIAIDLTAPVAPTVDAIEDDTGLPVLTGSYDASDLAENGVDVIVDGRQFTSGQHGALVLTDGTWTLTFTGTPLLDGTYDVQVSQRDPAGNVSHDLTSGELVVFIDADRDGISDVDELAMGTDPESSDSDGDGISDLDERDLYGTSPFSRDSDGDGIDDADEIGMGFDPNAPDSDGDGLSDAFEHNSGSNPMSADSDGDGLSDFAEYAVFGTRATVADTDGDGLSDGLEIDLGTRPNLFDTDGDGVIDGIEHSAGLDPLSRDTDGDGLSDRFELDSGETDANQFDTDDDGFSDGIELASGTSPFDAEDAPGSLVDSDSDGLPDVFEQYLGTNPDQADSDGDGLADGAELELGTNPRVADTDLDGVNDRFELDGASDPLTFDTDGDGLADGLEALIGSDPVVADSDDDGLVDGAELLFIGSDVLVADTDGDLLSDGDEVFVSGSDATAWDTDADGLSDEMEFRSGTAVLRSDTDNGGIGDGEEWYSQLDGLFPTDDASDVDSDGDGISDALETALGWDPNLADSDSDGLSDGIERDMGSSPILADSDGDGVSDPDELALGTHVRVADTDGDGLSDGDELVFATNPLVRDTDRDGIDDGIESTGPTDLLMFDTDHDGLADGAEHRLGTNPMRADTDGDGRLDGIEASVGSDPLVADTDGEDLDGDGLTGIEEGLLGTDPLVADTDGDGVSDAADWCPLDSSDDLDGDGVCNSDDPCPIDAADDSDGDGVCDSDDQCEGDDSFGDSDLDGVCDDEDACALDPDRAKGPCFVDDQGGCTFSMTGSTAPFSLGFITLGLLAIRRRRSV